MGLFSKKKEIGLPPRPAPMDQDIPDLNQLLSEAPVPPPELQQLNLPFPKGMENGQFPLPPGFQSPFPEPQGLHIPPPPGSSSAKPLPAFEGVSSQSMSQQVSAQQPPSKQVSESFELPDFDEDDLKDIDDAEKAPKQMMEEETASDAPAEPTTAAAGPEEEDEEEKAELEYPEPTMQQAATGKDRYLEINRCFAAKESIEELRKVAKVTEDGIENHSAKETNERYHSLLNTLNLVQEKLILIDNKLFERL